MQVINIQTFFCCHNPRLSDSELYSCTHNLVIADGEVTVHILKKKKRISLLLFPSIPSSPPPPASSLHPIKSKPCVLLFSHNQSELTVQPSVHIWWGARGEEEMGGELILKGDEPHNTEAAMTYKQVHLYLQTNA